MKFKFNYQFVSLSSQFRVFGLGKIPEKFKKITRNVRTRGGARGGHGFGSNLDLLGFSWIWIFLDKSKKSNPNPRFFQIQNQEFSYPFRSNKSLVNITYFLPICIIIKIVYCCT